MLILDNVSVKRANRLLFQPVSCVIKPGEILTLQGESGRGKSTLLHALIHEEPQVELVGQVTLDGQCMNMSVRLSECGGHGNPVHFHDGLFATEICVP